MLKELSEEHRGAVQGQVREYAQYPGGAQIEAQHVGEVGGHLRHEGEVHPALVHFNKCGLEVIEVNIKYELIELK